MATGDQNDFATRLYRTLPRKWFPDLVNAPFLNAILQGLGNALANAYSQLVFAKAQMRLSTAAGGFIDLTAADYFGPNNLPRLINETDAAYVTRIEWNLTAPRGTRPGMVEMLVSLTGRTPIIIEPANTGDTGAWTTQTAPAMGGGILAWDDGTGTKGGGAWGSTLLPCQCFMIVYRPRNSGIAGLAGWTTQAVPLTGGGLGGWGQDAIAYTDADMIPGNITDSYIYSQIANWLEAGTTAWVLLSN